MFTQQSIYESTLLTCTQIELELANIRYGYNNRSAVVNTADAWIQAKYLNVRLPSVATVMSLHEQNMLLNYNIMSAERMMEKFKGHSKSYAQ